MIQINEKRIQIKTLGSHITWKNDEGGDKMKVEKINKRYYNRDKFFNNFNLYKCYNAKTIIE